MKVRAGIYGPDGWIVLNQETIEYSPTRLFNRIARVGDQPLLFRDAILIVYYLCFLAVYVVECLSSGCDKVFNAPKKLRRSSRTLCLLLR